MIRNYFQVAYIQKFYTGTSTGRLWDPVAGRARGQMMGRCRDVRRRSNMFFKFSSQTH